MKVSCFSFGPKNKSNIIGIFKHYNDILPKLIEIKEEYNRVDEDDNYNLKCYTPDLRYNTKQYEKNYIIDIFNDYNDIKYLIYKFNDGDEIYDLDGIDCMEYWKIEIEC